MVNQVLNQCYTCKAEDCEIKDCKRGEIYNIIAETAIVKINKCTGWTVELYQSHFQKQHNHKQNNIEQQNATKNNTKSHRQSTSEKSEINRLEEDVQ